MLPSEYARQDFRTVAEAIWTRVGDRAARLATDIMEIVSPAARVA